MKKSGRAYLPVIVGVVFVVAAAVFFFFGAESPAAAANEFMAALAKADVKKLAQVGLLEGVDAQKAEAIWRQTLDRSEYFRFQWRVKNTTQPTDDTASVVMDYIKNADSPSAYPENYSLPMMKIDGKWKVDVRRIPRDMYPDLPR